MATKKSPQSSSIDFNAAVYKEAGVKKAAREYAAFAAFSFARKGAYIRVTIKPLGERLPDNFTEEFANMAILNSI